MAKPKIEADTDMGNENSKPSGAPAVQPPSTPQPQDPKADSTKPETEALSNTELAARHLETLGTIIEKELTTWMTHLRSLAEIPTFEEITTKTSEETKSKALIHILETLPARHRALVTAYAAEDVSSVELSDQCATLLEELKKATVMADLSGYYDNKLFKAKRFREELNAQETTIREAEAARLHELKDLMSMFAELKLLRDGGTLDLNSVELLVQAMDDVGLSASLAVDVGKE